MWDVGAAVKHLKSHARATSHGQCARYTRVAIEAGGVTLVHHVSAKDYGSSLTKVGFKSQGQLASGYRAGDVAIIQPIKGHGHGHMCMYDGRHWISDFKQMHGLYPGPGYRKQKPAFVVYRYPGVDSATSNVEQAAVTAGKVKP
jgi:hypothetical protein